MAASMLSAVLDLMPHAVAIYDAQERLVLTNPAFRAMFPILANLMEPGIPFEVLLRASIELGDNAHALGHDREDYIARRLREFRDPDPVPQEILLADGRWVRVQDQRLPDGGLLCLRTDISELKRHELQLQESEQRYRQLVDLTPDGIVVHDSQGRLRFLNKVGRAIIGISPDENLDRFHVLDHTTDESRPLAELMLRRLNSGEALRQARLPLRRLDGNEMLLEMSALPFDSSGERLVLCLFRDVTAEAAASLRLRESEARARSVLETALDCIISIDDAGRIIEFNPAAERTFGWSRHEAVGQLMSNLIVPPGHRSRHDQGMERLRAGEPGRVLGRRIEIEAMRRDGTIFPVELAITAVPLGPGKRFTAYLRDITERRQAVQEIGEKTRILDSMLDNVGVGLEVYDTDGRLLIANRFITDLLEIPPDFMVPGLLDRDLVRFLAERGEYPGETVEQSLADYDRIRQENLYYYSERQRPNGRWVQVRHFPVPGGGFVAMFADITEQKKLEAQLLQSQKMEALGQLAGGIAHDFNNILSVIGGYADMARSAAAGNAQVVNYLSKIGQGVKRATALTRELLTFSRQKVAVSGSVDLSAVLRGQEFLLKPLLGATINLLIHVPAFPVWVAIDPDLAAQVLMNLAINARDAMPDGGCLDVHLDIDQGDVPVPLAGRPVALLRVIDRGSGMAAEVVERIFEPFFTTKPPGQGTGLGLAMVYGTVKQAGGAISVDSQPGKGSCFNLWFPLAGPPTQPSLPESQPLPSDSRRQAQTILLAEDEPDLLDIVSHMLEGAGYRVRRAADGVEALERFEEGGIDLLLTDLVMPDLGGVRLAHLVTALDPQVKVIFMTGYPGRGHVEAMDLPADIPVLYKPLEADALLAAIALALADTHST